MRSDPLNKLLRLLDKMEQQRSQIARLQERNEELEILLVSAIQELAIANGHKVSARFRREWLAIHDPRMIRFRQEQS